MFSSRARLLPLLLLALIGVVVYRPVLGWLRSLPKVQEIHPSVTPQGSKQAGTDITPLAISENDWPCWRGPLLTGEATGLLPTLPFCVPEDVIWKVDIAGRGHASPIVCGHNIFLLNSDESAETISLLSLNPADGAMNWACELHQGGFEKLHADNTQASSTPACDGSAVYCVCLTNSELNVSKVDFTGKLVWQTPAGPYTSFHGYGVSPLLHEDLVIVAGDNHGRGFISAIDRQSGELVWRTARQNLRSQGTPTLATFKGQDQLLYAGQGYLTSYQPLTGEKLWQIPAAADETANTPVASEGLLFATGGYPQRCVQAIRLDGKHDIVWEQNVNDYVPSLLLHDQRLLAIQDNGVARLFDAQTGDEKGNKRLGGDVSASPVCVGDKAVIINEAGRVFFVRLADRLELIGQTDLGSPTYASPAFAGGRVFLRTIDSLLCVDGSCEMQMRRYQRRRSLTDANGNQEMAGLSGVSGSEELR